MEVVDMPDEFDPAGPLLASSRKSLCLDDDGEEVQQPRSPKCLLPQSETLVLNDDEYAQYVQLSQNMVLQHQVKIKMPFPAGRVVYIRGREVILAIALFFFLTLSLGLVVAITKEKLEASAAAASAAKPEETCKTNYCESPQVMRDSGDFTINPCSDFWTYSCGGWLTSNSQTERYWDVSKEISYNINMRIRELLLDFDVTSVDVTSPANKAKLFYKQCMENVNSTDNLDYVIEDIVGR
jgi:hypothetical protein